MNEYPSVKTLALVSIIGVGPVDSALELISELSDIWLPTNTEIAIIPTTEEIIEKIKEKKEELTTLNDKIANETQLELDVKKSEMQSWLPSWMSKKILKRALAITLGTGVAGLVTKIGFIGYDMITNEKVEVKTSDRTPINRELIPKPDSVKDIINILSTFVFGERS